MADIKLFRYKPEVKELTASSVLLEKELAEFLGKEDCISMSTGFQTNLGVISAIAGRGDVIVCDKENHASIYDAIKLSYAELIRYNHNDMEDLEEKLKTERKKNIIS